MNAFKITVLNSIKSKNFILLIIRTLLRLVVLFILVLPGCKQKEDAKINIPLTFENKEWPRPAWISEEPCVFVGNWDAMPIFRRRAGGNPVWQEEDYLKEHTEDAVVKLKEMGITMAIIHFYKAFGIEAEKEHMDDSKRLAALLKKHGLKVGVYVGSTFGYESFLIEKPEAEKWIVPDYLGQPVVYGDQTFRKRVYFQHPEYKAYIKKVLRIAIEEMKADLIHFDNPANQGIHSVFFHPLAIEDFKTYLRNKYPPENLKKRFGFSDVTYVEPPKYNGSLSTINDPLFQEWTDFRCQQLADYYGEMEEYIRGLNPEVAVENNPHGLSGQNTMWDQSIDFPRMLCHLDFFWTEGEETSLTNNGILISKIRTFKMARTLNNRVFTYTHDSRLEMAEAMAFNRQGMGMVGGMLAGYELPEGQRNYIKFYHDKFEYYRNIKAVADVAVLHSYATMAFNNGQPYVSVFLFEQSLIQEKIPFDIIFDDNLKDLSKYKVLVLADQECLSDEKLDLIRNFVNNGGGLVATEHTSLYTEWRQRKREFGLKDLFQINAPEWRGTRSPEDILEMPVQKTRAGKGRVVYIPAVEPSIPKPPAAAMTSRYWKLPVNHKELVESVHWACENEMSVNINAPLTVTMELTLKEDKSAMILHLVNFNSEKSSVKNIKINIKVPEGKKATQVILMTPDGGNDETLKFSIKGTRIDFTVPQLSVYDVVVIRLE